MVRKDSHLVLATRGIYFLHIVCVWPLHVDVIFRHTGGIDSDLNLLSNEMVLGLYLVLVPYQYHVQLYHILYIQKDIILTILHCTVCQYLLPTTPVEP